MAAMPGNTLPSNTLHGAAAGAHVADLVRKARLVDGGNGIATPNQREGAAVDSGFRQGGCDGVCAVRKAAISNTPMGPFQSTVLLVSTASTKRAVVSGPMSGPIQSAGMALVGTTWVLASGANASAHNVSAGRSNSFRWIGPSRGWPRPCASPARPGCCRWSRLALERM